MVKDLYAMLEEQEGPTAAFVESVNENVTNWLYNHIIRKIHRASAL